MSPFSCQNTTLLAQVAQLLARLPQSCAVSPLTDVVPLLLMSLSVSGSQKAHGSQKLNFVALILHLLSDC